MAVGIHSGVDHRQRRHALGEIAADRLAELRLVADEIEDVVGDLERQAEVRAERAERGDVLGIRVGEKRGALAARGVQRSGLQLDALEVRLLCREPPLHRHLLELAVAEREHGLRDHRDDLGLRKDCGERVGLREQVVTDDERDVVGPHRVDRRHVPAEIRVVDDVVMHQRRGVHQFERLREVQHDGAIGPSAEASREEDERRTQELSRR